VLRRLLKTLTRTVPLDCYANRYGRRVFREIESAYREMLEEMVGYAVKHRASQSTLHRIFYPRFREKFPWIPTRIIKGAYRDAVRRARSFRMLRKLGRAYSDKPMIRRIAITYSDSKDWRFEGGVVKLRTHLGWVELHYRSNRLLHRYLYSEWKLAEELKLKLAGKRIVAYLTFTKGFEVEYDPGNVVAVDVNENNATVAVFRNNILADVYRVETHLGRMVIAYAERRRRITEGKSTKTREARKELRRLRERERKLDILRKAERFIERLAIENKAVVVVGHINWKAKEDMERGKSAKLRHRIHQWSVSTLIKLLEENPLHIAKVSEKGSSSTDPLTESKIRSYTLLMICVAVKGVKMVKVLKLRLRVARISGRILERDVVEAINIGLKHLNPDGIPVVLGSTRAHEVWVKLVNPHQGSTPLAELQLFTNTIKHR
jgi:IS605 OrfB family transposase